MFALQFLLKVLWFCPYKFPFWVRHFELRSNLWRKLIKEVVRVSWNHSTQRLITKKNNSSQIVLEFSTPNAFHTTDTKLLFFQRQSNLCSRQIFFDIWWLLELRSITIHYQKEMAPESIHFTENDLHRQAFLYNCIE